MGKTVLIRLWPGLKNCGRDGGVCEHCREKKKNKKNVVFLAGAACCSVAPSD